ncbi:MAG TPA: polysaccharide deacetylase family protein [Chthoniobacterales bacterium]
METTQATPSRALPHLELTKAWSWWRRLLFLTALAAPPLVIASNLAWWACVYAVCTNTLLLIGWLVPTSNWLGPVLNRLPPGENEIWLTIDDGPSADTIPLAQMLHVKGITATFFFRGNQIAKFPGVPRQISNLGHSVANHTMTHPLPWFWMLPPGHVAREIDGCEKRIRDEGVIPLPYFRCPAGVKNPFLHRLLSGREMTLAGWTVRAYDGIVCNIERSTAHILRHLVPGAILLVHEGKNDRAGNPASLRFIETLVDEIEQRGFRFYQIPQQSLPKSNRG